MHGSHREHRIRSPPVNLVQVLALRGLPLRHATVTIGERAENADPRPRRNPCGPGLPLGLVCVSGARDLGSRRPLLPGPAPRDPRRRPRHRDATDVRSAPLCRAAAAGPQSYGRSRLGEIQRAVLRAAGGASPRRRGPSIQQPAYRSLLYLSLIGYIAVDPRALRPPAAALQSCDSPRPWHSPAIFLPPLSQHSSFPLTDSWGLTLEIVALAGAPF